ncbi:hypothetical protein MMC30_004874 [Trapelia coarctata]|nr:hypothetical protein [Trapelia coarctata]
MSSPGTHSEDATAVTDPASLEQNRSPFVLVLVDGDQHPFHVSLLSSGTKGGVKAAHLLLQSMKGYLQGLNDGTCSEYTGADQWPVVVRGYANFADLVGNLKRNGVQEPWRALSDFSTGFARDQPLFDFFDAGIEKESVNNKILGKIPMGN